MFTCINDKGSSVIYYVLAHSSYMKNIVSSHIGEPTVYSDHCPVVFEIRRANTTEYQQQPRKEVTVKRKLRWDKDKKDRYIEKLQSTVTKDKISEVFDIVKEGSTATRVDDMVDKFSRVLQEISEPLFSKQIKYGEDKTNRRHQIEWLSDEGMSKRREYFFCLNEYRAEHCDITRVAMVRARNALKNIMKSIQKNY